MALSLPTIDGLRGAPSIHGPLDPTTLRRAGILGDPSRPDVAVRRAQRLIEQGAFYEARAMLYPHQRHAPAGFRARVHELLGVCAVHGGGDWAPLFDAALADYAELGDAAGIARVNRHVGEMLLLTGAFQLSDAHLERAEVAYRDIGDCVRQAACRAARARLRMRSGRMRLALSRIDEAIATLVPLVQPRVEGLARLDRSCIVAYMGDAAASARELITAERMLVASGNIADHLRARLIRAETLLILGDARRAAAGLLHLAPEVNTSDDLTTRARYNELLGVAIAEDNEPAEARRHLMRARHLYDQLGSELGVASCEVALARIERLLGLEPGARLKAMQSREVGKWPLLACEVRLLKAELAARDSSDSARKAMLEVRSFAASNHHQALVQRVDRLLIDRGLVAADELPRTAGAAAPAVVHSGATLTRLAAPAGGPQPMEMGPVVERRLWNDTPTRSKTVRQPVR